MQIQASEIQIDTSYRCRIIIGYKYFCMYKSRCILIDLYPALDQFLIIGLCHSKCIPLIRNMRHDDDHLNTTFRRTDQCRKHLVIQDQIRGHDMHIFFCMVQNMEIYFFSYIFMIKRAVCIWNHISQFFIQCIRFFGQIFSIRLHAPHIHIPHLQKYHRQALDSITS